MEGWRAKDNGVDGEGGLRTYLSPLTLPTSYNHHCAATLLWVKKALTGLSHGLSEGGVGSTTASRHQV
jgi:hypothetical protein